MIINGITQLNVQVVMDLVEAKILVAMLRQLNPEDAAHSLASLHFDGFNFAADNVSAVAQSFAFTLGNYTDALKKIESPVPEFVPSGAKFN